MPCGSSPISRRSGGSCKRSSTWDWTISPSANRRPRSRAARAQRLKIARELAVPSGRRNLYLLDEPTTGLHADDVATLVRVLHELVEQGHTAVVIEHNLEVIKTADYIIDLGPEGGDAGGEVVFTGTPEELAACETSYTGKFLKPLL